jgi:HEAT repeat protein
VLARRGSDSARQALVGALGGKDKDLATIAAASLGQLGLTEPVKTALLSAAQANPDVKQHVMGQLLQAGDPDGMRLAQDMLGDTEGNGANAAIWALASTGTPEAKRLLERALSSSNSDVRVAAISTLAQNHDDRSTDTLVRLTRDPDAQVRASALSTLGQVGSERAQQAIFEATRSGSADDRVAAISSLSSFDDPKAGAQLAQLMRDPDPTVAQAAIGSSYNAGPEVDATLIGIVNNPGTPAEVRATAAGQLRNRSTQLDPTTERVVTELAGPAGGYGGDTYGRVVVRHSVIDVD